MAVQSNFNLSYLLFLFLLPCHLAQPQVAPSPGPDSSGSPSSSPRPTQRSRLSPGTSPLSSPRPAQAPSQGSRSSSGPGPSPAQAPNPGLRTSPGSSPSASSRPELRDSGPAAGPGPSSDSYVDDDEIDNQEYEEDDDNSISSPSSSTDPSAQPPAESTNVPIQFDFSPTLPPSADVDPQVQKICDFTDNPSICLATISPYLNGETDVPSILDVAIEAGAQFTKHGQTTAKKLAGNPENTPQLVAVLNECSDRFGKAMESYEKASDAIPEHDKTTLNTMLSAVVAFVADCRDANSQDSELYSISDKLITMTTNSLAMSSLMD